MTRAPGHGTELDYTTFGSTGGARVVVVLRADAGAPVDPDPAVTGQRDVRIVVIQVRRDEIPDPGAYGGETPASTTVIALADLIDEQVVDADVTFGLVGVARAGEEAILLANRLGDRVDRLALVAVPTEHSPLERHLAERMMAGVRVPTLVVNGESDPDAGADAAAWHGTHLPDARVELIATEASGPDRHLTIADVWERVLSHTAPGDVGR